jgi:chemotaxis signal transduction protein
MPDGGRVEHVAGSGQDLAFGICRLGVTRVAVPLDQLSEVCQISELTQILVRSPALSGGINLREHLIPVIRLAQICGLAETEQPSAFAVVLRNGSQHLAFLVDQVVGITHVPSARVQTLTIGSAASEVQCVRTVFIEDGHTVSIVDVSRLFAHPEVVSVEIQPKVQTATVEDGRIPMLTFVVGGARFSVDAEDVYGTVPRQTIEVGAMTSGACLGSITYHQRRVPVLNTASVLGLGCRDKWGASEVVVLRCPNGRLIGLAVDAIQDIQRVDLRKHAQIPEAIARQHDFLTKVIMRPDGVQVFVLSAVNLAKDANVSAIAALSSDPTKTVSAENRSENARFLVVEAGQTFAIPLEQVTSIIQVPNHFVPVSRQTIGLQGFFSRTPHSVPLIHLATMLHLAHRASDTARVLLIGQGTQQVGFQVERVFSIEAANWRLDGLPGTGSGSDTLVQLGSGAARRATALLDLMVLSQKHFHCQS